MNLSGGFPPSNPSAPPNSNLLFMGDQVNVAAFDGASTDCIILRIPAASLAAIGAKIQVTVKMAAGGGGSFITPTCVIRRTLPGDVNFTDTTPLTFGGTNAPTFQ